MNLLYDYQVFSHNRYGGTSRYFIELISQVAKKSGVSASTLRFYEEKGLITSIGRQGIRRVFSPNVLERLELIALGRAAGFSLEEIGSLHFHNYPP